ncbi:unnamed protein product [Haemonchus placei]|uniref:Chaperonin 10-like protein n=1 Tax=Haemonchus placei TaxID=6290 RepID=A0A0N4WAI1_HAEPC|nr:unnamed protein product [Haemonchus placei]
MAANQNGDVVSVGLGTASKVIRCNNKGKWVAEVGDEEIEVSNAFCFVIPRIDADDGTSSSPNHALRSRVSSHKLAAGDW